MKKNTNNKIKKNHCLRIRIIQDFFFFLKKQKFKTKLINEEFFFFFAEYIHEQ